VAFNPGPAASYAPPPTATILRRHTQQHKVQASAPEKSSDHASAGMLRNAMAVTTDAPQRSRWPWISLIPIGLGAWAPIYAGVRARRSSWTLLGVLWCVLVIAGFIKNGISGHPGHDDLAGALVIIGWGGAVATSFLIRSAYEREMSSPLVEASEQARERMSDRQRAQVMARENPGLAQEMGIGRPDKHGATDAGLVDVNNASVAALEKLPGIDDQLATRIAEVRAQVGGFSSVEDLGAQIDLDGDLVEELRDKVVCLPREKPSGVGRD
jgi:DNA uptake protein ComE-like DNA-binding protein